MGANIGQDNMPIQETAGLAASPQAADEAHASFDCQIEVFMSGTLTANVRRLASMASHATDPQVVNCLCVSAVLMSAAALEALVTDLAYVKNETEYNSSAFRHMGVPEKYNRLTGGTLLTDYPAIHHIWQYRNAVGHSEVANVRSRFVGEQLNPARAAWIAQSVEDFARGVWGPSMPDWFRSDAGL
jgi:hypothetical protein